MPAPNIAFEGSPQELEAFMSQLQRSPELAGAFKSSRAPATLGGMSIEDILAGGSPEQVAAKKQEIAAAQLRMKDFLAEAADKGGRLGMLSVVSQLSENPELAKAVSGLDTSNRAAYAPKALGGKSIYNQSGMIADPAYIEAQQDAMGNKRVQLAQAVQAATDNRLSREAMNESNNVQRAALAQSRQEAARIAADAAAERQKSTLALREEQNAQAKLASLGKEATKAQLAQLGQTFANVGDMVSRYPDGEIPGIGKIQSKMQENSLTRMALGDEEKNNYATAKANLNIALKAISGSAVTGSEQLRTEIANMIGGGFTSQDYARAMVRASKIAELGRQQVLGGYTPDVQSRYIGQVPTIGNSFEIPEPEWMKPKPLQPKPGFKPGKDDFAIIGSRPVGK